MWKNSLWKLREFPRLFYTTLFCAKSVEEQNPKHIEPADDDTARDRNDNADYQTKNPALFEPSRPSYADFNNPVYNGNKKQ